MLSDGGGRWTGTTVGDEIYTDILQLIPPEEIAPGQVTQPSMQALAESYLKELRSLDERKVTLQKIGLQFGGRLLLVGPPGTDFRGFVRTLTLDIPIQQIQYRLSHILGKGVQAGEAIRVGMEFARRNTPCLVFVENVEALCPKKSHQSSILQRELHDTVWDEMEVLVVATTNDLQSLDRTLLAEFDRVHHFASPDYDERLKILEDVFKPFEQVDPTLLAELTTGWGFSDLLHLASSLIAKGDLETGEITRDTVASLIEKSGVIPVSDEQHVRSVGAQVRGSALTVERSEMSYPDDFLDQLYLMAVGDDYHETQRVIETLNSGLALTKNDQDFLSKYPFILSGSPEDRRTRLLRAKKNSDRLRRIMGC